MQAAEQFRSIWETAANSVGDAITTALFEGGKKGAESLKDLMKQLAKDLVRFWLQQSIVIPLQTSMSGGGFNWGSLFGGGNGGGTNWLSLFTGGGNSGGGSSPWGAFGPGSSAWTGLGGSSGGGGSNGYGNWIQFGRQLWNGFSGNAATASYSGLGNFTNGLMGMYTGYGQFGTAANWAAAAQYGPPVQLAGNAPGLGGFGTAAAGLAGAYYGAQNRNSTGGRIAGGVTYGALGIGVAGTAAGVAGGLGVGAAAGGAFAAVPGLAAIPVVGWILAALAIVDMISGGKLFGTSFRPESSTSTLSLSPEGGEASLELREVRNRSLFRGRQWRTRDRDPGDEAREAANDLYDAVFDSMSQVARQLSGDVPPMIDASIRTITEYTKKGKVKSTKILVDVLGRTWEEETAELAASRITSEAIIATIDSIMGNTVPAAVANSVVRPLVDGLDDVGQAIGSLIPKDLQVQGEASAIAERWRDDAEALAVGAGFLLSVASDIRSGFDLLETGTLTPIVDLVEELSIGGEGLQDTYLRLVQTTQLFEEAVELANVSMGLAREEFVRFAVDIADAAGGLERASQLWNTFFETFYSPQERATRTLQGARENLDTQLGDVGLSFGISNESFRAMFESLLPTLSPEQVVQWLEAAEAIRQYQDASLALAQIEDQLIAQRVSAMVEYTRMIEGIKLELADFSQFATDWLGATDWRSDAIRAANEHARAAGMAAAREEDLAIIELRAARMRAEALRRLGDSITQGAIDLGYIQPNTLDYLNGRIAELQNSSANAAGAFGDAAGAIEQATSSIRDQISLLLGDLSPFNDNQKLGIARQELQAGNITSEQYLQIARRLFGSTDEYRRQFEFAMQFVGNGQSAGVPSPGSPGTFGGSSSTDTRSLQELIAARDELLAQQRYSQAFGLAQQVAEYAAAGNMTFDEVAANFGFNLDQIRTDLGVSDDKFQTLLESFFDRFLDEQEYFSSDSINDRIDLQTIAIVDAIKGIPGWVDVNSSALTVPEQNEEVIQEIAGVADEVVEEEDDGPDLEELMVQTVQLNLEMVELLRSVATNVGVTAETGQASVQLTNEQLQQLQQLLRAIQNRESSTELF